MVIEQILVSYMAVFCYLVGDEATGEAALIDPADDFERIFEKVAAQKLKVRFVINTHGHPDHTSGNEAVLKRTGATLVIHEADAAMLERGFLKELKDKNALRLVKDGDAIRIGKLTLEVLGTPGHTRGGICLHAPGHLFTGDTLFTEGVGRTDLPGGSERTLLDSIRKKILELPDDTHIWPGHDYGRQKRSTVKEQKKFFR